LSDHPDRFASPPPDDLAGQVQWLVDRALIGDLLIDFARRVDTRDQAGYAANFTDDGVLELPFGVFNGREAISEMSGPPPPMGTHHLSTNHMIQIDGDTASSRSYLQATHIADVAKPTQNWKAGGWYDCTFRRTADGWKFTRVVLSVLWAGGDAASSAPVSRDEALKEA
jgi:ketosteroid isomerase-like protein